MLPRYVDNHKSQITEVLYIGRAKWDKLLSTIATVERDGSDDFHDEQVWTFTTSCAYAVDDMAGAKRMARHQSEDDVNTGRIWFELLPLPPRVGEGNTNLDLEFGDIKIRQGTKSGQFMFNLKATNTQIIGTSEPYKAEAFLENGTESVWMNTPDAAVDDQTGG